MVYYSEDSDSKEIDFDFLCRYGINIKIHDQRIERVIMRSIHTAVTQGTEQEKYDYSAVIKSNQSFDILTFVAVDVMAHMYPLISCWLKLIRKRELQMKEFCEAALHAVLF